MSARVPQTSETNQAGDLVSAGGHSAINGSAQEQYYRYMLMKEKLAHKGEAGILGATSEREDIEHNILEKLVKITESSPEFAQIVSITGSSDRFEQARILGATVYDKVRAEQVLSFYTPDKKELEESFYRKTLASASDRSNKLAAGASRATGTPAADILKGLFNIVTGRAADAPA